MGKTAETVAETSLGERVSLVSLDARRELSQVLVTVHGQPDEDFNAVGTKKAGVRRQTRFNCIVVG